MEIMVYTNHWKIIEIKTLIIMALTSLCLGVYGLKHLSSCGTIVFR